MPNFVPISDAVRGLLHRIDANRTATVDAMTSSSSLDISGPTLSTTASGEEIHITSSSVSAQYEQNCKRTDRRTDSPIGSLEQNYGNDNGNTVLLLEQQPNPSTFNDVASSKAIASNCVSPNNEIFYLDREHQALHKAKGYACFRRKSYAVSLYLRGNWKTQAIFFTKIMMTKSLQAAVILTWAFSAMYFFGDALRRHQTSIHFLILTLFLIMKIFVVSCKGVCTRPGLNRGASYVTWLSLSMTIEAFCVGTLCASLSLCYKITILVLAVCILLPSYMIISTVPHFLHSCIVKQKIIVVELVIVFVVSIIFISSKLVEVEKSYKEFFMTVWIPAVAIAEAVILGLFLWIREVIFGTFFNVHENDWLYVAACI